VQVKGIVLSEDFIKHYLKAKPSLLCALDLDLWLNLSMMNMAFLMFSVGDTNYFR
jgi:hypothetical protein